MREGGREGGVEFCGSSETERGEGGREGDDLSFVLIAKNEFGERGREVLKGELVNG